MQSDWPIRATLLALCSFSLAMAGCQTTHGNDRTEATEATTELADEQEVFWEKLAAHCGKAYAGEISDITAYYDNGMRDAEMVMHVMDCEEDRLHIPFHIDDDHSRNWILIREEGTILLKHDHRNPDGTEEEISQYGGYAPTPGLETRQIFPADQETAQMLPERADNFWFFDFVAEDRLQYGVHWPKKGHSIRVEFDLSEPVDTPPRPWGYEDED